MKKALLILTLIGAANAAAEPSAPAPAVVVSEGYVLAGGWTCESRGMIREAEARSGAVKWAADFERKIVSAGCMPVFKPRPVGIIALLGEFAYVCDRLTDELGESFYCTYTLTKNLRGPDGALVRDQFSKRSPTPDFFDVR